MRTEIRPVSPGRWDDVAEVLGENGGYSGCWCMFWRLDNQEIHTKTASGNRAALREMIAAGQPVGLLLYQDGHRRAGVRSRPGPVSGGCSTPAGSGLSTLMILRCGRLPASTLHVVRVAWARAAGLSGLPVGAPASTGRRSSRPIRWSTPARAAGLSFPPGPWPCSATPASRPLHRPRAAGCLCAACRREPGRPGRGTGRPGSRPGRPQGRRLRGARCDSVRSHRSRIADGRQPVRSPSAPAASGEPPSGVAPRGQRVSLAVKQQGLGLDPGRVEAPRLEQRTRQVGG